MSPVGETLRTRCRNFPGLVNNTSIDWFTAWPRQALHAVASQFLAEVSICHAHFEFPEESEELPQRETRTNGRTLQVEEPLEYPLILLVIVQIFVSSCSFINVHGNQTSSVQCTVSDRKIEDVFRSLRNHCGFFYDNHN